MPKTKKRTVFWLCPLCDQRHESRVKSPLEHQYKCRRLECFFEGDLEEIRAGSLWRERFLKACQKEGASMEFIESLCEVMGEEVPDEIIEPLQALLDMSGSERRTLYNYILREKALG